MLHKFGGEEYCAMLSLPHAWHRPADFALATVLIGGGMSAPDFLQVMNPWLAFAGGVIGLTIGVVRLWQILFNKEKKE